MLNFEIVGNRFHTSYVLDMLYTYNHTTLLAQAQTIKPTIGYTKVVILVMVEVFSLLMHCVTCDKYNSI